MALATDTTNFVNILAAVFFLDSRSKSGNLKDARAVHRNSYADNIIARGVGNAIVVASCQLRHRVAVLAEHFHSFVR